MKKTQHSIPKLFVATLLLVFILAACVPVPAPMTAPDTPAPKPEDTSASSTDIADTDILLEDTLWVLQAYVDASGRTTDVLTGTRTTAELLEGQISGSTGCNQYAGTYILNGNEITITLGPLTMMACPEPIMQQESDYLAALGEVQTYVITGNELSMYDASGTEILAFVADEPLPLVGTSWQVLQYNSGNALVSSLTTELMTAEYGQDVSLTGFSGCNNYSAGYEVEGNNIKIGPAAATRKMCSEPQNVMEDETGYLAALERAATFDIRGEELTLYDETATRVVVYRAAPEEVAGSTIVEGESSPVMVESVTVEQQNGEYVAVVSGQNSDACPRTYSSTQQVDGNTIAITLSATKPADVMCAQTLTPFTETIAINASSLTEGEYTVTVNEVAAVQSLTVGG